MAKVRFVRMWENFSPHSDQKLLPVLKEVVNEPLEIEQNPKAYVDIEVTSVYPSRISKVHNLARASLGRINSGQLIDSRQHFTNPPKSPNAKIGIWYTAENARPPVSDWDITLSFDPTGWTSNNIYLPYWQLLTDLYGGQSTGFLGRTLPIDELVSPRVGEAGERPRFCCAFFRNPDPVRMHAVSALRKIGDVDVYGLAGGLPVEEKMSIAANYRFILCFENDLYPGYVTEKVFDAWATGAVPLWWGIDSQRTLNADAVINLYDYPSLQEFVGAVAKLEQNSERISEISSHPLLNTRPTKSLIIPEMISKLINN